MEHRTVLGQVTNFQTSAAKRKSLLPGFKPGNGKHQTMISGASSRLSLGPGLSNYSRTSLGGSKAARNSLSTAGEKKRRQSGVGTGYGANKRTSAIGGSSLKANDPRPISSKPFMQQSIRRLIEFLTQHNYDYPISPKILARPTGKDFQNVLQFLFLLIDRNLRFGQKFTDEVPTIFKGLRYPFNISKTSLSAVGSMHTWPPLLASLVWLVELLECHESSLEREAIEEDENGDKLFFIYLRKAYQSFLSGDDDKYEELDKELMMNFEERNKMIKDQIEEEKERGKQLLSELERMQQEETPLEMLKSRKKDFFGDRDKFNQLIKKLQEHKENLEAKNREREAEVNARQEEYNEALRLRNRFQNQLENQEISAEDAERMNLEKEQLNQKQTQIKEDKFQMENEIAELEVALELKIKHVTAIVCQYNEIATTLKLIPKSAQNSQGIDFELKLNVNSQTSQDGMLNIDVNKRLKPSLEQLKDFAVRRTQEARTECLELQNRVDQNEEERLSLESELLSGENSFQGLEKENILCKKISEEELHTIHEETAQINKEIKLFRELESGESELSKAKTALKEAEDTLAREEKEFEQEEAELETNMHAFLDMILEHKQRIEDIVASISKTYTTALNVAQSCCKDRIDELMNIVNN